LLQILNARSICGRKSEISPAGHSFIFVCVVIVRSGLENTMYVWLYPKTIFIVWAASTCQLIVNWSTFRALWLQYALEKSKEVDCEDKWDGSTFHSHVCFFQCRRLGSQVHSNGEVDGLGKCSILDGIVMPHSHHSRRLFWPQPSLKKASHEKGPTGHHNHASLSPTGIIPWSPFVCGMFSGVRGLEARYSESCKVAARLVSWRFPMFCKLVYWIWPEKNWLMSMFKIG